MTISIYPARISGKNVIHADCWNKCSTLNMTNENFHWFFTNLLGSNKLSTSSKMSGLWHLSLIEESLFTKHTKTLPPYSIYYVNKLKRIVSQAKFVKSKYITYSER